MKISRRNIWIIGISAWCLMSVCVWIFLAKGFIHNFNHGKSRGLLSRAERYIQENNLNAALPLIEESIQINPTNCGAYYDRGYIHQVSGQLDMAIADYTKSINLKPEYAGYYKCRGSVYNQKKMFDMAISDYNKAISLDPYDIGAYLERGVAFGNSKNTKKALEDFATVIELDPDNGNAYVYTGIEYYKMHQYSRSMQYLSKGIQRNPKSYDGYWYIALIHHDNGNIEDAISNYYKFLNNVPPNDPFCRERISEAKRIIDDSTDTWTYDQKRKGFVMQE